MAKPLTRTQALQNRHFLHELRRTGNIRLSARSVGLKYSTIQHRRRQHPAFAGAWDAALAFAQARLNKAGLQGPTAAKPLSSDGAGAAGRAGSVSRAASLSACGSPHRTVGGEPVITRRNDGKLQMRAAQPGKLTKQCEQAFLSALSATANVRLSAAAAGASVAAFYRRRLNNPGFAREMRMALEEGYTRLETALLEAGLPESFEDDAWRHNDPPAMPPMTVNQALQLMYLHQKEARLGGMPAPLRRRPGESPEAQNVRLVLLHKGYQERQREKFRIAEAMRLAAGKPTHFDWAPGELPDLGQVTGWSRAKPHVGSGAGGAGDETANARPVGGEADPSDDAGYSPASGPVYDATRALFGGWRLGDLRKKGG